MKMYSKRKYGQEEEQQILGSNLPLENCVKKSWKSQILEWNFQLKKTEK